MRGKHVRVDGSTITFKFQGKSGVRHAVDINDRRLAKIIQRCQEIPGYELFQYVDGEGEHHTIDSSDVNDYLREATGQYFTAKDFRTWTGTVMACTKLHEFDVFESESEAKKNVVEIVKTVAGRLGNTPSVCRKCYIHPLVIEAYLSGAITKTRREHQSEESPRELQWEETVLMKLMQRVLKLAAA